jgi:hypothetical protein
MKFDYTDFIINGFCLTHYDKIDDIPIDDVVFDMHEKTGVSYPSVVPYEFKLELIFLKDAIRDTLLEIFDSVEVLPRTSNKSGVWNGTEPSSTIWHNDYREGGTMLALVYFDSMPINGSCGGLFHVKNNGGIYDCHKGQTTQHNIIAPQHGDVIFITHNRDFDHKVEVSTIRPRRVMSVGLDCKFEGE